MLVVPRERTSQKQSREPAQDTLAGNLCSFTSPEPIVEARCTGNAEVWPSGISLSSILAVSL